MNIVRTLKRRGYGIKGLMTVKSAQQSAKMSSVKMKVKDKGFVEEGEIQIFNLLWCKSSKILVFEKIYH